MGSFDDLLGKEDDTELRFSCYNIGLLMLTVHCKICHERKKQAAPPHNSLLALQISTVNRQQLKAQGAIR